MKKAVKTRETKKTIDGAQLAITALLLAGGLLAGIFYTGYKAKEASKTLILNLRRQYAVEQELRAKRAEMDKRPNDAVRYYLNLIDTESLAGVSVLDPEASEWTLLFPFATGDIDKANERIFAPETRRAREAMARVRLAAVLESMGKTNEAEKQYLTAAELRGIKDFKEFKEWAKGVNRPMDEKIQKKLEEIYRINKEK